MNSIFYKTNYFYGFLLLICIHSCQNINKKSVENIITAEDIQFGAFMLEGGDYTTRLKVFIDQGKLDCKIRSHIEERPEIIDFSHLNLTCSDGIIWDDVILLHSSIDVAKVVKKQMQDKQYRCIEVKVASFSTSVVDSINYIVYTKECNYN